MSSIGSIPRAQLLEEVTRCARQRITPWDANSVKEDTDLKDMFFFDDHSFDRIREMLIESLSIEIDTIQFRKCASIKEIVDMLTEEEKCKE